MKECKQSSIFIIVKKFYRNVYGLAKKEMALFILIGLLLNIVQLLSLISEQLFFDKLERTVMNGAHYLYGYLIFFALMLIMQQVMNGYYNFILLTTMEKLQLRVLELLHYKALKINSVEYEKKEYLDMEEKGRSGANGIVSVVITFTMIFTAYIPFFIGIAIYVSTLNPPLLAILACVFIPVIVGLEIRKKAYTHLENNVANLRRKTKTYKSYLSGLNYVRENRTNGTFNFFLTKYKEVLWMFNNENWKCEKRVILIEGSLSILELAGRGLILVFLFQSLINHKISIGSFAAVFSSIEMMFDMMKEVLCGHIGAMNNQVGAADNFLKFLELSERGGDAYKLQGGIKVENCSFCYPQTNKKAIENVNIEIAEGESIAIVGDNGAGKTTLAKLLMGIYLPTEGSIYVGDTDISNVCIKSLFANRSIVMQNFERYHMTLNENVRISNVSKQGDCIKALQEVGLSVPSKVFIDDENTMLSREFGGIDLSGGQWQRIAIARGIYRINNFLILDEPTASIDPLEESKLYEKFREIANDKTAIIVTHRIGCARIADRIIVMKAGHIDEIGTHEELIEKSGYYAKMFHEQAQWYY